MAVDHEADPDAPQEARLAVGRPYHLRGRDLHRLAPFVGQRCRANLHASSRYVKIHRTVMPDQKRPYRMKRRAELEARTRQRITESTVELHGTLGPSRTSISAVAERAGVRRSTVYRHFPDEAALFAACSSHWRAANPPPDPRAWAAIEDPHERTDTALRELYAFYGRTEEMYASLLRDEPLVPILQRRLAGFYGYLRT